MIPISYLSHLLATITLASALFLATLGTAVAESHSKHNDEHGVETGEHHEENSVGPHGGKLLTTQDMTLELALMEQGDASTYRAWIIKDNAPVTEAGTKLTLELSRLGGEVNHLNFALKGDAWVTTDSIKAPHSFDVSVSLQSAGKYHEWAFDSYEGRVEIAQEIATKTGIKSQAAGAAEIRQTLPLYGRTLVDPSRVSQIRARFPGTIIDVRVNIGDRVKAGDILAEVESSESLRRYTVVSPITGVITTRNGNPGELAQEQVLLTVANYDRVWSEFRVFPSQRKQVLPGQRVVITTQDGRIESAISHLLPSEQGQPFMTARVPLDNKQGQWPPGQLLEGKVIVKQTPVALAVDNRALQSVGGRQVVFLHVGDTYEVRPLVLGLSDDRVTQVIEGLNLGNQYATENSYLLKAELEKSSASHHH